MTVSFSGSDLIRVAIGIEGRGSAFYAVREKATKNSVAREVFKYLKDMEREHLVTFQNMLTEAGNYQSSKVPPAENSAYLQGLVDTAVFTDEQDASEMAVKADNDMEAMDLAIGAEKDSILFYYEMKDIVSPPAQPTIEKIIAEEKTHLRRLSELKNKLAAI